MAILIEDVQIEHLAGQIAIAEGISVTEVFRESLQSLAGLRGVVPRKAPLRERLTILAHEVDAVPTKTPTDIRSNDEILGYNEDGVW